MQQTSVGAQPVNQGARPRRIAFPDRIRARMAGPGGLYNIGNAIGLFGGLALAVLGAQASEGASLSGGLRAGYEHLAGSWAALSISLAMLIFFWSGELYHRAWAGGAPPDLRLNRRGDLLSGYGALALGLGLLLFGEPLLAATAGLLHAFGKFGSALHGPSAGGWRDPYRVAVLVSRGPALALALAALVAALALPEGVPLAAIAAPALLILCYLIWARADLMLLRGAG
ncbi:MAG: hypothetical protein U1E34_10460 [Amaricoccus sp.]